MNRRLFVSLTASALMAPDIILAQSKDEVDFREFLFDLRAFMKGGRFSYNDYKPKAEACAIQLDRYKRRKGSNKSLIGAAEAFIDAKKDWEAVFDELERQETMERIAGITSREAILENIKRRDALEEVRNASWKRFESHLDAYTNGSVSKEKRNDSKK